jgi:hypothetical protein
MRLVLPEFDEPPLPDEVQDMLAKIANKVESKSPTKARVSVSLEALKALAEQVRYLDVATVLRC